MPRPPIRRKPALKKTVPVKRVARANPARIAVEYIDITDIHPYEWNPRDNSEAIPVVAESIKKFGFLVPVVIDANNVLVTGHTRVEAVKFLGWTEIPAIRATNLTPEQINAYRLVDNKVAEKADWNYELLAGEITKLGDSGIDLVMLGWSQEELDCLSEVVAADCLDAPDLISEDEQRSRDATAERRAPTRARFVLGEITLFVETGAYRAWADGIRQLHDFNEDAIILDIKRRLGITT